MAWTFNKTMVFQNHGSFRATFLYKKHGDFFLTLSKLDYFHYYKKWGAIY